VKNSYINKRFYNYITKNYESQGKIMERKTEKKGFVMYLDYKEHFNLLSDEQLGKLLRIIYEYEETGVAPKIEEGILQMAFSFIRLQLDRDKEKYESEISKRKAAGKKGGESRWGTDKNTKGKMANDSNAINDIAKYNNAKKNMAKIADTDTVTDTVTDTDMHIEENTDVVAEIRKYYIKQSGEKNPPATAIVTLFKYDLSIELIKKSIDLAVYRGKKGFDYINGILSSWKAKGFKTIEDLKVEAKKVEDPSIFDGLYDN